MFYTYLWLREDGTPYYVGKGSANRAFTSHAHGVHKPAESARILVQEFPCEADAFAAEKFLVAYYGRKDLGTGCLRNLTVGGEGPSGFSEETLKKMSVVHLGKKHLPRTKVWIERNRLANVGKKHKRVKPKKTHCKRGHARTPDNLNKNGACIACRKLNNKGTPAGRKRATVCINGHARTTEKPGQECKVCREERRKTEGRKINNPGALKPKCSRGHLRTPDNVYASGECKTCAKEKSKIRRNL